MSTHGISNSILGLARRSAPFLLAALPLTACPAPNPATVIGGSETSPTATNDKSGDESGDGDGDGDGDGEDDPCPLLPDDLQDLKLWLRADLGVMQDQQGVTDWLDQGPAGNDAYRHISDANGPTPVPGAINGHPVLRFEPNERLFFPNPALTNFTIFEVGRNSSLDENFYMILGPAVGSQFNQQVRYQGSNNLMLVGPGHGFPDRTYAIGNNKIYHSLTIDGDGGDWAVYRDGDFIDSLFSNIQGTWQVGCIGAWFSQHYLRGDVAELIIFERSLSDEERDAVQCYLDARYNLP